MFTIELGEGRQSKLAELFKHCALTPRYQPQLFDNANQVVKSIGAITLSAIMVDLCWFSRNAKKLREYYKRRKRIIKCAPDYKPYSK